MSEQTKAKINKLEDEFKNVTWKPQKMYYLKKKKGNERFEEQNKKLYYVLLAVKNLPANAADIRDMGLIPGGGHAVHPNILSWGIL